MLCFVQKDCDISTISLNLVRISIAGHDCFCGVLDCGKEVVVGILLMGILFALAFVLGFEIVVWVGLIWGIIM